METRHPQFYNIIFYSEIQIEKFIEVTTKIKITEKDIPIGEFIYIINR